MRAEGLPASRPFPLPKRRLLTRTSWGRGAVSGGPIWHACIAIRPTIIDIQVITKSTSDLKNVPQFQKDVKRLVFRLIIRLIDASMDERSVEE